MPATIELIIRRNPDGRHTADARLTSDTSAAAIQLASNAPVMFDQTALNAQILDPAAYGTLLSTQLFASPRLRNAWLKARAYTAADILQLRLNLDPSDESLHALRWETLHDPETKQPIALHERVRLVRTLDSSDLTPVIIPPRPDLHALIIIASPLNLNQYGLAEVDVEGEVSRARAALGDIPTTILADHTEASGYATRINLAAALRNAPPLVLLVTHGVISDGVPFLCLEQEDGTVDWIADDEFVEMIYRLEGRPLLFILASCRSAGTGYNDKLSALGPQLASIGVPAVIGFQGDVAMSTVKTMLPVLLSEVRHKGQIDQAMAAARAALGERRPWWQAVLWLRTDGRLWREKQLVNPTPTNTERTTSTGIDSVKYADHLLQTYHNWMTKYTPLFANRHHLTTYVIPTSSSETEAQGFPVAEIPSKSRISIILGESGSGKTTALWKVVIDYCQRLKKKEGTRLPILITMRQWLEGRGCEALIREQFSFLGVKRGVIETELQKGNCLILVDGLNELPPDEGLRINAYNDLQRFINAYNRNYFVICCRSADFSPRMLGSDLFFHGSNKPGIYEIRRLDRKQVSDYIRRHFKNHPEKAESLLVKLEIDSNRHWKDVRSILNLARIPLYLQLIINEFEHTGELPRDKGKLIHTLVRSTILREEEKSYRIDQIGKERVLSIFAYQTVLKGNSLRLRENYAIDLLRQLTPSFKASYLIPKELTIGAIWQEILSGNFLKKTDAIWVEWLHQIILDYFLACEISRIETEENPTELKTLYSWFSQTKWDQPYIIALGMLDYHHGSLLIEKVTQISPEIAWMALENRSDEDMNQLLPPIFTRLVSSSDTSSTQSLKKLAHLVPRLPYVPTVESLIAHFKAYDEETRSSIAEGLCELVIKNYTKYNEVFKGKAIRSIEPTNTKEHHALAVKRTLQFLITMSGNRNGMVRFYAAKGLWGHDRGRAASVLREIYNSPNPTVQKAVRKLMAEWKID